MNDEYDLEGALSGMDQGGEAATPPPPMPGLAATDPVMTLRMAKERMEQLTKLKEQMHQQAKARQAAMENLARAYSAPPDSGGMDPGLMALGHGIASAPASQALAGFTSGMQGMQEARQKLAERDWARQAAAAKIRAEAEQQNMTDVMNEGRLDSSMLSGGAFGRGGANIREYTNENGERIQVVTDPYSGQVTQRVLGKTKDSSASSAPHLKAGFQWMKNSDGTPKLDENGLPVQVAITDATNRPTSGSSTKAGSGYLSSLSPEDQNIVKGVAEGSIDPKSLSMKSDRREHILSAVRSYDPTYNQQRYPTAQRTLTNFTVGKQGDAVRSFNVAIHHLDTLSELGKALDNNDMPALNSISNYFSEHTGSPKVTNFEGARDLVADEVVKAIVGAGGALADREAAAKKIKAAASPAQLSGMIDTYKKLFGGQLNGLKQQYEAGTGRKDFNDSFLTPQGRAMSTTSAAAPGSPAQQVTPPHPKDIQDLLGKYGKQ